MAVYTDVPAYARTLLALGGDSAWAPHAGIDPEARPILDAFFGEAAAVSAAPLEDPLWRHLLVSGFASASQYDRLIGLARAGVELPDGVACVARTGSGFHGFRGRSWAACTGNLHLTVHLAPHRPIERFETVFLTLAAVSVVEAIDRIPGLEGLARIKWVNDVLLHGAKVAGVLAYTQTRGATVTSAVLGIGLNVETAPSVRRTPFVPAVGSLREFASDPAVAHVPGALREVLRSLARNYRLLLDEGYRSLMERYRARSAVLGEEVLIGTDDGDDGSRILRFGRVAAIGDGLELRLAGQAEPVTKGRLILAAAARELLARDQLVWQGETPYPHPS